MAKKKSAAQLDREIAESLAYWKERWGKSHVPSGFPTTLRLGAYTATFEGILHPNTAQASALWLIKRGGKVVGRMFDGSSYGWGRPHSSMRELVWGGRSPEGASSPKSPDYGMTFDQGPSDSYQEALANFARSADRLIDWRRAHGLPAMGFKQTKGRAHATKQQRGAWTTSHKTSGATVFERRLLGALLTVIPMDWTEPSGPANWAVTRGHAGDRTYQHKRGQAASLTRAKEAAMRAAQSLGSAHATIASSAAFEAAKAQQSQLEQEVEEAGAGLRDFPRGAMGLTPDAVKTSPAYRAAKARFDRAFARLRAFNATFTKKFARELRAERSRRFAR